MFRKIFLTAVVGAALCLSCAKAPTQTDSPPLLGQDEARVEQVVHPVTITASQIAELRASLPETAPRLRTNIRPPMPNQNQWPVNNIPRQFIVVQLDGITGQHVYCIHESVVPEEGVAFDMIEQVHYLEDGSVVGGIEFSPHGTIFLDKTYLFWDFSYLFETPPTELDLLYWSGAEGGEWLVNIHRELTPSENRRVEFEIEHFSVYAVRQSTMPKPPPPAFSVAY